MIYQQYRTPDQCVLTAIDSFKALARNAIVIGGGAPLVADAIRERMGSREIACGG